MRLRLMATYLGVPYQAGLGPDGTEVTLFSPAPPLEELGFTAAGGHWRKQVDVADLGALWQSRPVGEYRGEPCLVLDDLGDRLHIAYLGRDSARAAQLGYWEIDREVFEVVVARHDVTGLTEERVEFPLTAAMFSASGAGPEVAGRYGGHRVRGRDRSRGLSRGRGDGAAAGWPGRGMASQGRAARRSTATGRWDTALRRWDTALRRWDTALRGWDQRPCRRRVTALRGPTVRGCRTGRRPGTGPRPPSPGPARRWRPGPRSLAGVWGRVRSGAA